MIDPRHLRLYVVRPVLCGLGLDNYVADAEELLMATAAQESGLRYLRQLGAGPARGLWQMEPATHDDIRDNYLAHRAPLADRVLEVSAASCFHFENLTTNLAYACAMARVHYRRVSDPLPAATSVQELAAYWKQHYNTPAGRGTVDEYLANYRGLREVEARRAGASPEEASA